MVEDSDQWVGTGEAFRQKLYQALWTPESLAERVAIYPAYLKRPIEQIPSFEVWLALAQVQGMEIGPDGIVAGTADNTPMDYYNGEFFNPYTSRGETGFPDFLNKGGGVQIAMLAFGGAVAAAASGTAVAASEAAIMSAEAGAIEGTAFTAIEAGEIGAEFVASEYAGTELAAEFATEFAGEEIAGEFFVEEIASEEFATELFVEEIAAPEVGAFSEPVYAPQPSPAPRLPSCRTGKACSSPC